MCCITWDDKENRVKRTDIYLYVHIGIVCMHLHELLLSLLILLTRVCRCNTEFWGVTKRWYSRILFRGLEYESYENLICQFNTMSFILPTTLPEHAVECGTNVLPSVSSGLASRVEGEIWCCKGPWEQIEEQIRKYHCVWVFLTLNHDMSNIVPVVWFV